MSFSAPLLTLGPIVTTVMTFTTTMRTFIAIVRVQTELYCGRCRALGSRTWAHGLEVYDVTKRHVM